MRSAEISSGPAGSTPSITRLIPEVITATHSGPDGLGNHCTARGMLERGKARSLRPATIGWLDGIMAPPLDSPNSANCAGSTPDSTPSSAETSST